MSADLGCIRQVQVIITREWESSMFEFHPFDAWSYL